MNFKFPSVPDIVSQSTINTSNILSERITSEVKEKEKRYLDGVNRENRMIELLESIDKNTSILPDMLKLLEENTKDQKAILEIINDFNTLATISNREEKQNFYRKIIDKINTTISDVETLNTLMSYGLIIYNTLQTLGKI